MADCRLRLRHLSTDDDPAAQAAISAFDRPLCNARQQQRKAYSMNNSDLADTLASAHNITKADARKLVDGVFAAIADAAAKGEEISLNGFGKFKVKESAAREGRNPSTGATIQIAASKKLGFTPAKAVKDKLNG
ncbi:hypothetical protein LTR94_008935 [Friedmanniomyces endolithicus]|nr:hypothetical protein LTR94_008935 [Friedmanniomyces endolithicus]